MNSRLFCFFSLICAVLFFSGCGADVVNDQFDEIRLYSWETQNGEIYSRLEFDGDNAVLTIVSPDSETEITGICLTDDSRLVIFDDTDEYCFGYTLAGKALTLKSKKGTVTFERVTDDSLRSNPSVP